MSEDYSIEGLKRVCIEIRKDILNMLMEAGSGHTGGSLSCVEILAALYYKTLNIDLKKLDWPKRDRFILSKGHGCPALYATMAHLGFFDRAELVTLRKFGSRLQGHPNRRRLPGLESSSGSLGQGLSIANGIAMNLKLEKIDAKVFCLLGDGELDEGQVWEAAMTASHYKLNNLCAIIDRNKLQIDCKTEEIMALEPVEDKFKAFNWHVITVDGHNLEVLVNIFNKTGSFDKPLCVIANTVKGKGVSFIEGKVDWHGIAPKPNEFDAAVKELG